MISFFINSNFLPLPWLLRKSCYFQAKGQYSSGVVEGLNAKVKLTLKRSYGFRTADAREVALYHTLANLPEPIFTHSFF